MITLEPIGVFFSDSKYPYEARRQAVDDTAGTLGEIRLHPGRDFEQALEDLEGFERLWILYHFHHNSEWKPKVMPPRGPRRKRGVFATRAPYRPNGLGLSCVRLVKVDGLRLLVEGHDLLDGTPVLDIKPYLPYADAFPEAHVGWLEEAGSERWQVDFSAPAAAHLHWLEEHGLSKLRGFIQGQLEFEPLDHKRKRVETYGDGYRLCYRTWRADFTATPMTRQIQIESIHSGYSEAELAAPEDPYSDKSLHRLFVKKF
jgi:tRNA-Thr(GGU) m(6)t(6)A37 methyltransferase TsaA